MRKTFFVLALIVSTSIAFANSALNEANNSFTYQGEPIHPAIIRDLSSFISDSGDQVVSLNLLDSQGSNRYFGDVEVTTLENGRARVCYKTSEDDSGFFCYIYVGKLDNDIYVVETIESGGGSGRFTNLLLLSFEEKKNFRFDSGSSKLIRDKEMIVINRLGGIPLGDRFVASELRIEGDKIYIGKDVGWFSVSGGSGGADNIAQDEAVVVQVEFD